MKKNTLNIIKICMMACSMATMLSCSEHIEPIDRSLKVGNILLSDDRIISPSAYNAAEENAVGVIFYTKNDTAFVVAKKELGLYAYSDSTGNITNVNSSIATLDGLSNTAALLLYSAANKTTVPAATRAAEYKDSFTGWYLPSCGELKKIAENFGIISRAMRIIGGDEFNNTQYVSSSQDGTNTASKEIYCYCVSINSGHITSCKKTEKHSVRPVLIIR